MDRVQLPDGRWFDADLSERFTAAPSCCGKRYACNCAPSQRSGVIETLFRTRLNAWVLHRYGTGQPADGTWAPLSEEDAARWLRKQDAQGQWQAERFFPAPPSPLEA